MEGILNYDYVRCPICGYEKKRIYIHLKKKHNLSVDEFREQYPDCPTTCESLRSQIQRNTKIALNEPEVIEKFKKTRNTPEGKEKARKGMLAARNTPGFEEKRKKASSEKMKELWSDPEWKEKTSESIRESLNTERVHQLHHDRLVKQWQDPEYRKNITNMVCDMVIDGKLGVKKEYTDNQGKKCVFRSSWELSVHNILNELSIKHSYESRKFFYQLDNGDWRLYLPDFYIEDYNCFLEVKPKVFQTYKENIRKLKAVKDEGFKIFFVGDEEYNNKEKILEILND